MIIGVTGTLGSGKGTVVEYLAKRGFKHYSVREFLTREILKRGLVVNIDSMVMVANDLRERFGAGYIIEKLIERAKENGGDSIVESIRTLGEVDALREERDAVLFAVDADIDKRYFRISGRASETDNLSFDEFVAQERRQINSDDPGRQNLRGCISRADYVFHNNGTVEELHRQVEEALKNIIDRTHINFGDEVRTEVELKGPPKYVRPTWDEYFVEVMDAVGKRGTCDRGRSGCVVVRDKHILVTGYVGSPAGLPHCDDIGHQMKTVIHEDGRESKHCVRTAHAEQNAICQAAKLGVPLEGATIYVSMTPCSACAKMIINSGIKRVVARKRYHDGDDSEEMFKMAGVLFELLEDSLMEYDDQ